MLQRLMTNDSFTIADISAESGLSVTSIAKYVGWMRQEGLIDIVSSEPSGKKGRRAVRYGVRQDSRCVLGVDMKPNCLGIGLMNLGGERLDCEQQCDFRMENTHECLESLYSRVQSFLNRHSNLLPVLAANVNIGGRVNSMSGTSASVFNFEETIDTPLAKVFSERFGFPVFIENDTKAMAYGEYVAHQDKGWKNILYVNIGWGLGLGIIIDGKIYYGGSGYSGEMGHMRVYENGILCHCGQ